MKPNPILKLDPDFKYLGNLPFELKHLLIQTTILRTPKILSNFQKKLK
jgi:hypothetical protein